MAVHHASHYPMKHSLHPGQTLAGELAVFGGSPAFDQPLYVGRPNIGDRQQMLGHLGEILERRWLTNSGPLEQEFERRLAAFAGVKHCIAMCNATVALELAIRALEMQGEVIVPAYTFVATAHALQWQQITPVFADMDPSTHNLDPARLESLITPRTTGIIGVHVWGRPCETEAIEAIAHRHGLRVMYDAAHAFGCSRGGRMVGGFGECEVFSFHATKFINSFEGGAVVTNNDALAEKLRLMRNFGFKGYDNVVYLGINGKMPEVCAAMGLTSLEAMDSIVAVNRRNFEAYRQGLAELSGVSLVQYDLRERNNFQYVVVDVDPEQAALRRDELVAVLHAENVLARKYFWPGCHRMEPYRTLQPDAADRLPQTERMAARLMVLPTGQTVGVDVVAKICGIISSALSAPTQVRAALAGNVRQTG